MVITVRSYTPGKVGEDEGFNAQENLPEQQIDAVEKIQEIEKKSQDSLKIDEGQDIKPVTSVVEGEYFTTRKSLMENQQFMNSARDFLQDKYNIAGTGILGGRYIENADDEQIFDKYLEHFRHFDSNIGTTMLDLNYVVNGKGSTQEKREQYAYLLNNYEVLQGEWSTTGGVVNSILDYVEGAATDVTNYIALIPFFGQGQKVATEASKQAVKIGLKEFLKKYGTKEFAKSAGLSGAQGAVYSGGQNILRQNTQIQSGAKDEFDFGEFALTTGAGGVLTGVIGGGVGVRGAYKNYNHKVAVALGKENYKKNLNIKYDEAIKNKSADEIEEIDAALKTITDDLVDNDFYAGMAEAGRVARDTIGKAQGVDDPLGVAIKTGDDIEDTMAGTVRNIAAMSMDIIKNLSPEDKVIYLKGLKLKGKTGPKDKKISQVIFDLLGDGKISTEQYGLMLQKYGLDHSDYKLLWWSTVSDAGKILQKQAEVMEVARNALKGLDDASKFKQVRDAKLTDAVINDAYNTNASSINNKFYRDYKNLTDVAKGSMVVMPSTAVRNYVGSGIKLSIRGLSEVFHGGFTAFKHLANKAIGKGDGIALSDKSRIFSSPTGIFKPFKTLGAIWDQPGNQNLARDIAEFYDSTSVKIGEKGSATYRSKADDLFTNYLEIEQRLTGGYVHDNVWKYGHKIVHGLNILNRTQEYSIRGSVFLDTLDRIATQKKVYSTAKDLDGNAINTIEDLVSSGKIKDFISEEDIATATKEALDATYSLEPPKGTILSIINWIRTPKSLGQDKAAGSFENLLKGAATTGIAFPRFVFNSVSTALRYSPIGAARGAWGIRNKSFRKGTDGYKNYEKFWEGVIGTGVIYANVHARVMDAVNSGSRLDEEQGNLFQTTTGLPEGKIVDEPIYLSDGEEYDQSKKIFGEETNQINIGGGVSGDITPFFPGSYFNALGKIIFDINYRPDNTNLSLLVKDFARSTIGSTVRTGAIGHSIDALYATFQDEGYLTAEDVNALRNMKEDDLLLSSENKSSLPDQEKGIDLALKKLEKVFLNDGMQLFFASITPRIVPGMVATQLVEDVWSTFDPEEAKARETSISRYSNTIANRIPGYRKYLLEKQDAYQEKTDVRPAGLLTQFTGVRFSQETPWVEGELQRLGIEPWKLVNIRDGEIPYYTVAMRRSLGRKMQAVEKVGIPMYLVSKGYLDLPDADKKIDLKKFVANMKAEAMLEVQNDFYYLDKARDLAISNDEKIRELLIQDPYRNFDQEKEDLISEEVDSGDFDRIMSGNRSESDVRFKEGVGKDPESGVVVTDEKRTGLMTPYN